MDEWRASLTEYRIAWITALGGIALILLVSAWPELFTIKPGESQQKTAQTAAKPAAAEPAAETPPPPSPEEKTALEKVTEEAAPAQVEAPQASPEPETKPSTLAKRAEPKPATAAAGYYVQVGAFKDATGAEEVAGRLKQHGWPAVVVPKNGLYAVWAGPRQGRTDIETLQQEILRGLKIKGFIVQKKGS